MYPKEEFSISRREIGNMSAEEWDRISERECLVFCLANEEGGQPWWDNEDEEWRTHRDDAGIMTLGNAYDYITSGSPIYDVMPINWTELTHEEIMATYNTPTPPGFMPVAPQEAMINWPVYEVVSAANALTRPELHHMMCMVPHDGTPGCRYKLTQNMGGWSDDRRAWGVFKVSEYLRQRGHTTRSLIILQPMREGKLREGQLCRIEWLLPPSLIAMLKASPTNPVFRTQVLAALRVPIPDELESWTAIRKWIESTFDMRPLQAPPPPLVFQAQLRQEQTGTTRIVRRYVANPVLYYQPKEVEELVAGKTMAQIVEALKKRALEAQLLNYEGEDTVETTLDPTGPTTVEIDTVEQDILNWLQHNNPAEYQRIAGVAITEAVEA